MMKSLRRKFIWINMLLVSIVVLVVFTALCVSQYQRLEREGYEMLRLSLNRKAEDLPPKLEFGGDGPPKINLGFERAPIFVVEKQGDTLRLVRTERIRIDESDALEIARQAFLEPGNMGVLRQYNLRYLIIQQGSEITKIALMDLSMDDLSMQETILTSLLLCALSLAAFFLVSVILSRIALRPVEKAWKQQKRFVADASHELKTPLTVILASTGILKSHPEESVAEQMQWVSNTEAEAMRMKKLVDDLLFLAKSDDTAKKPAMAPVSFSDLTLRTTLAFEALAFERSITLCTDVEEDLHVYANEAQIAQLLSILLDNAFKYAPPETDVLVSLHKAQNKAILRVHNQSEPLSKEALANLFDRFYRADQSRASEGYGLGLSIAKHIVEVHDGKINVESNNQGTVFTVQLFLQK